MSKRIGREGNSLDQSERPWRRQVPRLTFRSPPQMLSLIDEAHAEMKMMVMMMHTCKKRGIAGIYPRNFFWIFRKILG